MRKFLLPFLCLAAATAASAIPPLPPPPPPAPPPKLLVVVSVEGLSSELWARHRSQFTGGLARVGRGTVFATARQGSGAEIARVGELLKAGVPNSLSVAVAGDQASVVALGGAAAQQRWHWTGAGFAGNAGAQTPTVIARANAAVSAMIASPEPPLLLPPACIGNDLPAPGAAAVSSQRFARPAGDAAAFAASPAMDGAILAVAAALTSELGLGSDTAPDLLAIGLPATGRVSARFGAGSEAMCLQLHSLDRDLGGFLAQLDRAGRDYAVVLTGRSPSAPIMFWRQGMTAAERNEAVQAADIVPTLAAMFGLPAATAASSGRCLAGIAGIACPPR